jgi:beta-galactosidase/beta-glucuronidase
MITKMEKPLIYALSALAIFGASNAGAQWKAAGDKIKTEWAEQVDPANVLPEYPRPQMVRSQWVNLNGLWDFALTEKGQAAPASFSEQILVPFAVESSLSGLQRTVTDKNELWYSRTFEVPAAWRGKDVLLHFGAVDWRADVFVNGNMVGTHQGGFTPFSFNVTPWLNARGSQKLQVRVWDPTDRGFQPRGKQIMKPSGIWYTAVSGIWQTVWMEPVAKNHIAAVKSIPNVDGGYVSFTVCAPNATGGDMIEISILDGGKEVARAKGAPGANIGVPIPNAKLWSPDSPFLYDVKVALVSGGKRVDAVDSYTAMRKISFKRDGNGIQRMYLNDKALFHFGPLDQGWWPDGLYTAPTDEALLYDILKTKEWGYNMIRKHVKVEPARWYWHCDREGILVWQDMPSGDGGNRWDADTYGGGSDKVRTLESKNNFYQEWKEIMDLCMSNPSVVIWVPFNEAWGQFDTEKVAEWTKNYDPSRLVNPASGGNHRDCGDMVDNHNYPKPKFKVYDSNRVTVLGEYGGIGLPLEKHLWNPDMRNWGYIQFKNADDVTNEYISYAEMLEKFVISGYAAAVYTQTTDVEGEVNGIMTYDRKVIKMDEARLRKANLSVIESMTEK